jgi:hypothetical protein
VVSERRREGRAALPAALLLSVALRLAPGAAASDPSAERGIDACAPCHAEIVASYRGTAHFQTSAAASQATIRGSFAEGKNVLRTRSDGVFFRMEKGADGCYQTGYERGASRRERFDLVIGSGRRGQSYLYWKGDLLFQLPVSYLAAAGAWVNSPGYPDGTVHFDRLIPPRCLECHANYFRFEGSFPDARFGRDYVLGIGCQRCHGAGANHADLRNPARLPRERRIEACALCHSGIRESRKPLYGFRTGDDLDAYLAPETAGAHARPDVHGNQVALLRSSRCFAASPALSCSTCHDVHRAERSLAALSERCLRCHNAGSCKLSARVGPRIADNCIDCHMPSQQSNVIAIQTSGKPFFQSYRNHRIAIYPDPAGARKK